MTLTVGDIRRLGVTIRNSTGNAVDPTTLTIVVRAPSGTETTYTYGTDAVVVKSSTGVYQMDLSLTEQGKWKYDWTGTGTAQGSEGASFIVRPKQTG